MVFLPLNSENKRSLCRHTSQGSLSPQKQPGGVEGEGAGQYSDTLCCTRVSDKGMQTAMPSWSGLPVESVGILMRNVMRDVCNNENVFWLQ